MYLLILIDIYYMHNNNNYQCKMCWNKALTFGVGSINSIFVPSCLPNTCMFSIQMLLHFSQIVPRVCTLVLFILSGYWQPLGTIRQTNHMAVASRLYARTIVFTQYMHVFDPNVITFQSNCAEGLHFSAFHSFWLLAAVGYHSSNKPHGSS